MRYNHHHISEVAHNKTKLIMKASASTASLAIAMMMAVAHSTWAHQDDNAPFTSASAGVLRGFIADQEERLLGKGGGGGGGNNGPNPTPNPTAALTPAPTSSPIPYSCGTRSPVATPAPTHSLTPEPTKCENPGVCNGKNLCCAGFSCRNKACVSDGGRLLRERNFPFEELAGCTDLPATCNVDGNLPLCGSDIPSYRPPSLICNYGGGEYKAEVQLCDNTSERCCEDGNGGYYFGQTCWGTYQGGTCCPKGQTRVAAGCVPLNCCDGDSNHQNNYCPNNNCQK